MICDITDHLPIFTLYDEKFDYKKSFQKTMYKRLRTEEAINSLYHDLIEQDWNAVYIEKNVDCAFDNFLGIFSSAYNKNCPIRQISKNNLTIKSPWLTKSLQNACKKKNTLYRQFIRLRTEESEHRYKNWLI